MSCENSPLKLMIKFQKDRLLDKQKFDLHNETVNIVEEVFELNGYSVPKEKRYDLKKEFIEFMETFSEKHELKKETVTHEMALDAFADMCEFSVGGMLKMGFCPKCVLLEMGKHINSRTGKIVDGKFQKDPNAETYEPVYGRCVLECDSCEDRE